MRTPFRILMPLALGGILLCTLAGRQPLSGVDPPAAAKPSGYAPASPVVSTPAPPAAKEQATTAPVGRVAAALDKPVTFDFKDEPLEEVRKKIGAMTGIPVEFDEAALREADVRLEKRITFAVKDVTLRSALRLLLGPISLTTMITRDDTLLITTRAVVEARPIMRLYNVRDLIETPDDLGEIQQNYKTLIDVIMSTVRPQSWDAVGGPGIIQGVQGALAIDQTGEIQDEVALLLAALRDVRQRQEKSPGGPAIRFDLSPAEEKAQKRFAQILAQPFELEFKEQPLKEAMEAIGKRYQLNIQFDESALKEAGVGSEALVSFDLKGISLRAALQRICRQLKLTYVFKDEVLLITTQECASSFLVPRLYPVADLVEFGRPGDTGDNDRKTESLISAIYATVRDQSWDQVGGPGSIKVYAPAKIFVVSQNLEVYSELDDFLAQLRAHLREHPPAQAAKQVAFEDRLITKVFELKPSTDKNYLAASSVADLVKNATGSKAWQAEGTLVLPSERIEIGGGKDQSDQKITHPSLIVRNKPAVLRDARRLLKELNVWPEPEEKTPNGSGSGPAFAPKAPVVGSLAPPNAGEQTVNASMPAPAKCEGHGGVCPATPTKPGGP